MSTAQRWDHAMTARRWARSLGLVVVAAVVLVGGGCTDDTKEAEGEPTSSTAETPPQSVPGSADSLLEFETGTQVVAYRGGVLDQQEFADVTAEPEVETPMPVIFAATVDSKLSDLARNQVRTAIASATDERGEIARADPIWVQRDSSGDVALMVVVDNPTSDDLSNLTIRAELLKPDGTSNGVAEFKIPPEELLGLPADTAAFLVLTFGEDRLEDPKSDVTSGGVRLDLTYS